MEALRSPIARVRANPWLAVGIAVAALLVAAWLAWAIYVGSDRGVNEGIGVLIAWPAMVAALALISLPFIGIYLLVKRLSSDDGDDASETEEKPAAEEASEEQEETSDEAADEDDDDSEGGDEEEDESEDDDESEDEDEPEDEDEESEDSEPEPETAAS